METVPPAAGVAPLLAGAVPLVVGVVPLVVRAVPLSAGVVPPGTYPGRTLLHLRRMICDAESYLNEELTCIAGVERGRAHSGEL